MKVYESINKVQKALSVMGISKSNKNQQQGYNFRGIDDVYNALSPILAESGLCILPRMLSRECNERITQKGTTLFYVTVDAEFDLVSAEDGSKHTIKTFGEAMDSGDKATNKAMSAAYKYACMQAFAIPTEGDNDADLTTQQMIKPAAAKSVPQDIFDKMSASDQEQIRNFAMEIILMASKNDIAGCVEYVKSLELDADWTSALWSQLDSKIRSAIKKYKEENK
jgi:hypothetical protein